VRLPELIGNLEAALRDELDAQGRLALLLASQEQAVVGGHTAEIERTGAELEVELARVPVRDRRRRELLSEFGRVLGVPASMLTVRSLIERVATCSSPQRTGGTERVEQLRGELRTAVLDVRRRARKLSVLAKGHSEVLADVLRVLLGGESQGRTGGILVDAEA
jgi:hypothetical protein